MVFSLFVILHVPAGHKVVESSAACQRHSLPCSGIRLFKSHFRMRQNMLQAPAALNKTSGANDADMLTWLPRYRNASSDGI
jgi:hypothetical protein